MITPKTRIRLSRTQHQTLRRLACSLGASEADALRFIIEHGPVPKPAVDVDGSAFVVDDCPVVIGSASALVVELNRERSNLDQISRGYARHDLDDVFAGGEDYFCLYPSYADAVTYPDLFRAAEKTIRDVVASADRYADSLANGLEDFRLVDDSDGLLDDVISVRLDSRSRGRLDAKAATFGLKRGGYARLVLNRLAKSPAFAAAFGKPGLVLRVVDAGEGAERLRECGIALNAAAKFFNAEVVPAADTTIGDYYFGVADVFTDFLIKLDAAAVLYRKFQEAYLASGEAVPE